MRCRRGKGTPVPGGHNKWSNRALKVILYFISPLGWHNTCLFRRFITFSDYGLPNQCYTVLWAKHMCRSGKQIIYHKNLWSLKNRSWKSVHWFLIWEKFMPAGITVLWHNPPRLYPLDTYPQDTYPLGHIPPGTYTSWTLTPRTLIP